MPRRKCLAAYCLVLAAMIASSAFGQTGTLLGPIVNPANNHWYYLLDQSTWTDAEIAATALGGNLATVNDTAENNFICSTFSNCGGISRSLWIGYYDPNATGQFTWANGEVTSFTKWAVNQPTELGQERWVYILPSSAGSLGGQWNNYYDFTSSTFNAGVIYGPYPCNGVVEVVPEPASLSFLALGGLALMRRRNSTDATRKGQEL